MSDNIVLLEPATLHITPIGFAYYAEQFLTAAHAVKDEPHIPRGAPDFSPVPYYLCCRAVELTLKAFLLTEGHTLESLKKRHGHNLESLWKACTPNGTLELLDEQTGLRSRSWLPPAEFEADLERCNGYYASKAKAFEYFDFERWASNYEGLPPLGRFADSTASLVAVIKDYCVERA